METILIWHNPRCGKSREGLKLLETQDKPFEVVKYLDKTLTKEEINEVLSKLGYSSARELMRTQEKVYKELALKEVTDEEKLVEAMAANPKLIERPIIIKGDKAVVARPAEKLLEIL